MRHRTHSLEGVSYHNAIPENNGQTMHSLEQLHSNVSILYYNARSILPKLDCLRAEAAVKKIHPLSALLKRGYPIIYLIERSQLRIIRLLERIEIGMVEVY